MPPSRSKKTRPLSWVVACLTAASLMPFSPAIAAFFELGEAAEISVLGLGRPSPDAVGGDNFFHFVTAHGPFELTAIALAAGAGLRLGVGLFSTGGLTRAESLRESAMQAVPVMAASAMLFICAAFTEGFLSPSPAPYIIKAMWAVLSSGLISFYFVVLGFPRDEPLFSRMDEVGEPGDAA